MQPVEDEVVHHGLCDPAEGRAAMLRLATGTMQHLQGSLLITLVLLSPQSMPEVFRLVHLSLREPL